MKLAERLELLEAFAQCGIGRGRQRTDFGADGGETFFDFRAFREIILQRILGGEPWREGKARGEQRTAKECREGNGEDSAGFQHGYFK